MPLEDDLMSPVRWGFNEILSLCAFVCVYVKASEEAEKNKVLASLKHKRADSVMSGRLRVADD